jgi:hypothetical protein
MGIPKGGPKVDPTKILVFSHYCQIIFIFYLFETFGQFETFTINSCTKRKLGPFMVRVPEVYLEI